MTSRSARSIGFTLLEVLAGILVLGLLYTVLASAAIRGLRSEGTDRRRAEASLVADRELASIESQIATGAPLENGVVEREEAPYTIVVDVQPEDVLALLPAPLYDEIVRGADPDVPTLLVDEKGESRVQRLTIVVEWDESGEPDRVARTTYAFDTSQLGELFPSGGESAGSEPRDGSLDELRKDAPPELQQLLDAEQKGAR